MRRASFHSPRPHLYLDTGGRAYLLDEGARALVPRLANGCFVATARRNVGVSATAAYLVPCGAEALHPARSPRRRVRFRVTPPPAKPNSRTVSFSRVTTSKPRGNRFAQSPDGSCCGADIQRRHEVAHFVPDDSLSVPEESRCLASPEPRRCTGPHSASPTPARCTPLGDRLEITARSPTSSTSSRVGRTSDCCTLPMKDSRVSVENRERINQGCRERGSVSVEWFPAEVSN